MLSASSPEFPYQYDQKRRDMAQLILKREYNKLKKQCEVNCKCFTGPHSVLQVFIEKIVQAIECFVQKLKRVSRDELKLWHEEKMSLDFPGDNGKNYNELNYSINGIDLNLILKIQSLEIAAP